MRVFDKLSDPLKIVGAYLVVASLWVVLGNYFVVSQIDASIDLVEMRTIESGLFILLSSVLIFVLLQQKMKVIQEKNSRNKIYIQELHHRVRNNMSVIMGLIEMESADLNGEPCRSLLNDLRVRIISLATCQELLYKYRDPNAIPMNECIQRFLGSLGTGNSGNSEIQTRLDEIFLNINQAIPLAFIISEIMLVNKKRPGNGSDCQIQLFAKNEIGSRIVLSNKMSCISSRSEIKTMIEDHILEDPITKANTKQLRGHWTIAEEESFIQLTFEFEKFSHTGSAAHNFI